jgi:flavin reductase (DIM6/NTAB) family NADH-FMN oxidoreductase RutF
VAASPVHFECRLTQQLRVPGRNEECSAWLLIGQVIGLHIDDAALDGKGLIDTARLKPLARLGYRDYTCVERVFDLDEYSVRDAAGITHLYEASAPPRAGAAGAA